MTKFKVRSFFFFLSLIFQNFLKVFNDHDEMMYVA